MVLGVGEASGGKAVERNFPSLTALRRSDLLGLPKSIDKLQFMCRSWLFIEWCDRAHYPRIREVPSIRAAIGSVEGGETQTWSSPIEI
jgi:hypothetical protein